MNDSIPKRAVLLRTAVALSALLLAAESDALEPARLIGQYAREVWLPRDGLPASPINSILQTRDGYLWLATHSGVARFDGVRFVVLDTRTAPELKADSFWVLGEDATGRLWIGTEGRGLILSPRGPVHFLSGGFEPRAPEHRSLSPGREGVRVGTYGDGLQLYARVGSSYGRFPTATSARSSWTAGVVSGPVHSAVSSDRVRGSGGGDRFRPSRHLERHRDVSL